MTRVYQIKGYYIRQRLDYKTANGFLNTLNPKLSYIDTVLIIFQTVRWYGGTGGSRVGLLTINSFNGEEKYNYTQCIL